MNKTSEALEMAIEGYEQCLADLQGWATYADEYFQEKWDLKGDIKDHEDNINSCKEALAAQLSENSEPLNNLQQRLALKDLEIMQLREALEDIRDGMNTKAINNTVIKSDTVYRFAEEITEALSIQTTYDDLMAWHDAQLGEPVAWLNPNDYDRRHAFMWNIKSRNEKQFSIPLYARKDK